MVAKLKHGRYGEGWFKIRNPRYSQREGRRELFETPRSSGQARWRVSVKSSNFRLMNSDRNRTGAGASDIAKERDGAATRNVDGELNAQMSLPQDWQSQIALAIAERCAKVSVPSNRGPRGEAAVINGRGLRRKLSNVI
jgi:hypothetical protein